MVISKRGLKILAINCHFSIENPGSSKSNIFIIKNKAQGFIQTENLERLISLLLKSLLKEEIGDFFTELFYLFSWQKCSLGSYESSENCVYQILVFLSKHVSQNLWESSSRILNLSHHYNELIDSSVSIQLIWQLVKVFLKVYLRVLINEEHSETVIITI